MKKILIIIVILFSVIRVNAYENDMFNIDVPDDFKLITDGDYNYKWIKDNKYISIIIDDNSIKQYNINTFTDEDVEKQKQYIEEGINKGLENYKITAELTDTKKLRIKNSSVIEYHVNYSSKEAIGYNTYQIGRMYTTNKYIVTIVYNSDKEINEKDEYSNILDTFNVKDEIVINKKFSPYVIIIIVGTVLGIIGYFIDRRKKR